MSVIIGFLGGLLGVEILLGLIFAGLAIGLGISILAYLVVFILILIAITFFVLCVSCIITGDLPVKILGAVGALLFIAGGIALDLSSNDDFFREREKKQLATAKTFLSFENTCETEDIEAVDIIYYSNPKFFKSFAQSRDSKRMSQGKLWKQVWPSKGGVFTIDHIPLAKPDNGFVLRIKTRDKTESVINEGYEPQKMCHIVYFARDRIDAMGEETVYVVYNGSRIIIRNEKVEVSDEPFFKFNTVVRFIEFTEDRSSYMPFKIVENNEQGTVFGIRGLKQTNENFLLRTDGLPKAVIMRDLEQDKEYTAIFEYHDEHWKDLTTEKKFLMSGRTAITVNGHSIQISETPDFCKFDFTDKPLWKINRF